MLPTGRFHLFPTTLNPTAQEFRPTHQTLNNVNTYQTYTYPFNVYNQPPQLPQLPPPFTSPTRTLLLSSVPADVSESIIRRDLELFGDVRAVQMERIRDGIVTVHFYDLRQCKKALQVIQEQHMQQQSRLRKHFEMMNIGVYTSASCPPPAPPPAPGLVAGRAVWAQFCFPVPAGLPDGYNQGTIVVFNLDADVDAKQIFEAYGCVKELRGTPSKKNQRFVEYYDTRDAAKALNNMNGKNIMGKTLIVEFSRPGGHKNIPKQKGLNTVNSVQPLPVILARKLTPDTRAFRPPPIALPSPSTQPSQCSSVSMKGANVQRKSGKKLVEQTSSGGSWTKQRKCSRQMREKFDPRFLFREDGVISEMNYLDPRTTVMIKNIPNKYSQKLLLNMLDNHCIHCNEQITGGGSDGGSDGDLPLSAYDFVYLPIDFMNKCNVGYGFVNMTSPEATWRLYKAFHHQNWEVFNSKKICEVSYARLQGIEALKEHFKNSRFPCDAEEYMPVVFSPPRDGRVVTDPSPLIKRSNIITTSSDQEPCSTSENEQCCNSSCSNDNVTVVEVNSDDNSNNYDAVASDGVCSGGDD
ncbi:Nucleotide-binding, alpha-beta plait [Artemisia annua]|uniref:Nucleotide-binding, alpha-beta plait n=1 Tax=Artemisia annua TaxID=35608 RepID=A0A2U1L5R2_ARTAN|nr:Nucleotide-binding, alpha-beta plait [Artemisia annua]